MPTVLTVAHRCGSLQVEAYLQEQVAAAAGADAGDGSASATPSQLAALTSLTRVDLAQFESTAEVLAKEAGPVPFPVNVSDRAQCRPIIVNVPVLISVLSYIVSCSPPPHWKPCCCSAGVVCEGTRTGCA